MKEQIFHHAKNWILEAGQIVRESFQRQVTVSYKTSASDLVTQMDTEIEEFFEGKIKEFFPAHFMLGEEGISKEKNFNLMNEVVWIVDPIDGTTNFVHQKRNFSISVGVFQNGEPLVGLIYDPVLDELFYAEKGKGAYLNDTRLEALGETTLEQAIISFNHIWLTPNQKCDFRKLQTVTEKARGIRSIGSASLEMAYVACGRLDAYLDFRLSPWDIAAGLVILSEVGAHSVTLDGSPVDFANPGTTLFSRPGLTNELFEQFN